MNKSELVSKRLKARHLIVVKGMPQGEVAKVVGVSYVSVCNWNKRYKWKDQAEKAINRKGGMQMLFDEFKAFLRKRDTLLADQVDKHWNGFIAGLEKEYRQK